VRGTSIVPDFFSFMSVTLSHSLRQALLAAGFASAANARQEPLPDKGLAHDHVRLAGTGWLARVPKQSQMDLSAECNLAYQSACFERASVGGHTPALRGCLPPSAHLPRGALLVEEIKGRAARLPQDLLAIAESLARLHALRLPDAAQRAPLLNALDPLQSMREEVAAQASHLLAAKVGSAVRRLIEQQLQQLQALCLRPERPERRLIAFDGHPGNFVVRDDGRAMLVDLEKCRYSYPGLDLAHATLYTSTTWDVDTHAVLELPDVLAFYRAWGDAVGEPGVNAAVWHLPLRRAMWLWSVTWCAKWRVLSSGASGARAHGEDWSSARSEPALVQHVRERVDHYLSEAVVRRVLNEFDALEEAMPPEGVV
jgi:thiamine kinase-like enzyme